MILKVEFSLFGKDKDKDMKKDNNKSFTQETRIRELEGQVTLLVAKYGDVLDSIETLANNFTQFSASPEEKFDLAVLHEDKLNP